MGILFLLVLIVFMKSPAISVQAADIPVKSEESIQEAINKALSGDTIVLQKGIYSEKLTIDKAITIRGEKDVVIEGNGEGNVITIVGEGVTIEGLTVQNSGTDKDNGGIYVQDGSNHVIKDNVFKDTMNGIYIHKSTGNIITGNQISSVSDHFSNRGRSETTPLATADKVNFVNALSNTGLKDIEVTSFVSPKWVPQMADAEELLATII